jgi:hypothetical protein
MESLARIACVATESCGNFGMDNSDCTAKPCFSNTKRGKKKFLVEKCGSKKTNQNKT